MKYFPDLNQNELPDRSFLWTILGTLRTNECKQLLEDARKKRSNKTEENKDELIEIAPDFLNKIILAPTISHSIFNRLYFVLI